MSDIRLEIGISEQVAQAIFLATKDLDSRVNIVGVRAALLESDWCVSWWTNTERTECMGAMFGKVPEMHVAMRPEYRSRWLNREIINEFLSWYFCNYELARVEAPAPMAARILRHIGFHDEFNVFTMTRRQFAQQQGLLVA